MNTADKVDQLIKEWTDQQLTKHEIIIKLAQACEGWSYVWGADGQYCTSKNRKSFANRSSCPDAESQVICKKCQILNGQKSSCEGCKWFPNGKTRFFDCRGFTRWLLRVVGVSLMGGGATSQWNDNSNWIEKDVISKMPTDKICCLFMKNGKKMAHTGMYILNNTVAHCSGEVKVEPVSTKWTHYAIPNMDDTPPTPVRPTISYRKHSKGDAVKEAQQLLINKGYDVGPKGADGIFGKMTDKATRAFQTACGIKVDGIIGKDTWARLLEGVK